MTLFNSVLYPTVKSECPFEFLLQLPTGGHRERAKELPEVDAAIGVGVKSAENVLGKFARIAIWKEKARWDSVRPFTAIPYLYGDKKITAYCGKGE